MFALPIAIGPGYISLLMLPSFGATLLNVASFGELGILRVCVYHTQQFPSVQVIALTSF